MKKSRVGLILGFLALILMTTGCSSLVSGKWAAKVNGDPILIKDYDARVADAQKYYESLGQKFDTEQGKQLKSQMLGLMIQEKIFAQEVRNQKLNPEDAKVKEQLDGIKINNNLKDDAEFQDALKKQGLTEAEFKNYLTLYLKVTDDVNIPSDTEVKAFFDKNAAKYSQPESVKARHILLKTEDEAKAIIAQLETAANSKTPILPLFEQLAKDKSIDTQSKDSGGDLGSFTKGRMVPDFEAAAFAQKEGTFSTTPVHTEYGYHVILVEAHTSAVAPEYAKVKPQVEKDALSAAKDTKFGTYFDDLRKKAKIEYSKGYQPEI
jgi:parvulin-like peptidyl-prolyl isomerase